MEGHTLADGLAEFPQAFPELYRATVAAGEQSGHLDVVLDRLADYTEARHELRQRVSNAMVMRGNRTSATRPRSQNQNS